MAEIWLFKVLGVPLRVKISNPCKTRNMGPRVKIFRILEKLPKGYLYTKKEQILFFEGFQFYRSVMKPPKYKGALSHLKKIKPHLPMRTGSGACSFLMNILTSVLERDFSLFGNAFKPKERLEKFSHSHQMLPFFCGHRCSQVKSFYVICIL